VKYIRHAGRKKNKENNTAVGVCGGGRGKGHAAPVVGEGAPSDGGSVDLCVRNVHHNNIRVCVCARAQNR